MTEQKRPRLPMTFELAEAAHEMRGEGAYHREGHTARTLVHEADLRVVLISMKAGSTIHEHRAAATATVHTLSGHIRVRFPDWVADVATGRLLMLERDLPHSVEALDDSVFLLTLSWRSTP